MLKVIIIYLRNFTQKWAFVAGICPISFSETLPQALKSFRDFWRSPEIQKMLSKSPSIFFFHFNELFRELWSCGEKLLSKIGKNSSRDFSRNSVFLHSLFFSLFNILIIQKWVFCVKSSQLVALHSGRTWGLQSLLQILFWQRWLLSWVSLL